jgi:excisionase family DNA binding protein
MLTISQAATLAGVTEETVRRWVRSGRLPAHRDGPRILVAAEDVSGVAVPAMLPLPAAWAQTSWGEPQPDWVALLRRSRGRRR